MIGQITCKYVWSCADEKFDFFVQNPGMPRFYIFFLLCICNVCYYKPSNYFQINKYYGDMFSIYKQILIGQIINTFEAVKMESSILYNQRWRIWFWLIYNLLWLLFFVRFEYYCNNLDLPRFYIFFAIAWFYTNSSWPRFYNEK